MIDLGYGGRATGPGRGVVWESGTHITRLLSVQQISSGISHTHLAERHLQTSRVMIRQFHLDFKKILADFAYRVPCRIVVHWARFSSGNPVSQCPGAGMRARRCRWLPLLSRSPSISSEAVGGWNAQSVPGGRFRSRCQLLCAGIGLSLLPPQASLLPDQGHSRQCSRQDQTT